MIYFPKVFCNFILITTAISARSFVFIWTRFSRPFRFTEVDCFTVTTINFLDTVLSIFYSYSIFRFTKQSLQKCFQYRKWILLCEIWDLSRCYFVKSKIRSTFYAESTLRKLLCKPKDRVATEDKDNIVYEIDCSNCKQFTSVNLHALYNRIQMSTKDLSGTVIQLGPEESCL